MKEQKNVGQEPPNNHEEESESIQPERFTRKKKQLHKKARLKLRLRDREEMNCPQCIRPLVPQNFKGVDVMRCRNCHGLWLDAPKLDRLENTVFPEGEVKGTVIFNTEKSRLLCPVCLQFMQKFNYRHYDLVLDFCPDHGYWLDKDEDKMILRLMKEEADAWNTKIDAEEKWPDILMKLKMPSFWSRLKSMR